MAKEIKTIKQYKKEADKAADYLSSGQEFHSLSVWLGEIFSRQGFRDFMNAPVSDIPKVVKELITKKKLKQARADFKDKALRVKAADRLMALTGGASWRKIRRCFE